MLEQYKRAAISYNVANDDFCNLKQIRLIPLGEFLEEMRLDVEDFSRTDKVLETPQRLCNIETMESVLHRIKFVRYEWQRKNIFFLGTKLHFPQKVPKEYPPEDIYPFLSYEGRKAPYFRPSFHYKLYDHRLLNKPTATPWHVAVY